MDRTRPRCLARGTLCTRYAVADELDGVFLHCRAHSHAEVQKREDAKAERAAKWDAARRAKQGKVDARRELVWAVQDLLGEAASPHPQAQQLNGLWKSRLQALVDRAG